LFRVPIDVAAGRVGVQVYKTTFVRRIGVRWDDVDEEKENAEKEQHG
jgi:hypothetical protein